MWSGSNPTRRAQSHSLHNRAGPNACLLECECTLGLWAWGWARACVVGGLRVVLRRMRGPGQGDIRHIPAPETNCESSKTNCAGRRTALSLFYLTQINEGGATKRRTAPSRDREIHVISLNRRRTAERTTRRRKDRNNGHSLSPGWLRLQLRDCVCNHGRWVALARLANILTPEQGDGWRIDPWGTTWWEK